MQQEHVSQKPSSDDGLPKAPETTSSPSPASLTSAKAPTPDDSALEALVLSARKTGWAECVNEVTKLMVIIARIDDRKIMFKVLVEGIDDIHKQGATLRA